MCGGQGYYSVSVPLNHQLFGKVLDCPCTAPARSARLQATCGLNSAERSITLDDIAAAGPGTRQMVKAAQAFIETPRGFLTLWGGPGNAKTMVLQAIVNQAIGLGRMAVYITMLDLLDYIREAYAERQSQIHESASRRLSRYANVEVLCIDEVDKVKTTDWTVERETALFDIRYRSGLVWSAGTVLAMNANPATLPDWIYSRLSDGRNTIIENADPDLRRYMKD